MTQIESYLDLYGIAYEYKDENGNIIHLDPRYVRYIKRQCKSDFERFKELYDSLGVHYDVHNFVISIDGKKNQVKIDGEGKTEIIFDDNGKLIKQCFWE